MLATNPMFFHLFNITPKPKRGKCADACHFYNYKEHAVFYIDQESSAADSENTVVLIHGFPTASYDWWKIWDQLIANFRVITVDMTGFGFSDKPKNYDYSIFDQANLFEELLSHLAVGHCYILSHDYGDKETQELNARNNQSS